MSDRVTKAQDDLGIPLTDLSYLVEALESAEQALTGIARLDSATIVITVDIDDTERQVTATYQDRRWLVLL